MHEHRLPPQILAKASLRGGEYAWPPEAVEEAVAAAARCGLATLGAEVQFRIPEGTCELYWHGLDSGRRLPGEPWGAYVARSAAEVLAQFRALRERADFIAEALRWPDLARLHARGEDLNQYLCFVLYFDADPAPREKGPT